MELIEVDMNQVVFGVNRPLSIVRTPGRRLKAKPVFMDINSMVSLLRPSLPHSGYRWTSSVWVEKVSYNLSMNFMQLHPAVEPGMRSILLDWLIEVSEAYALQRHTFYLAKDYFDRFMLSQYNIGKQTLQVIGATCLFLATKMEEPSSLSLSQLVYVGDGAYTEQDVRKTELLILKTLQWYLHPETALFWLELYLQLVLMEVTSDPLQQQFPIYMYLQITRLLDICTLHVTSLDVEYKVLAAAVLSHFIQNETVEKVSGLSGDVIKSCMTWMAPFATSAKLFGEVPFRKFRNTYPEEWHNIQTHTDYLTMLAQADQWR